LPVRPTGERAQHRRQRAGFRREDAAVAYPRVVLQTAVDLTTLMEARLHSAPELLLQWSQSRRRRLPRALERRHHPGDAFEAEELRAPSELVAVGRIELADPRQRAQRERALPPGLAREEVRVVRTERLLERADRFRLELRVD